MKHVTTLLILLMLCTQAHSQARLTNPVADETYIKQSISTFKLVTASGEICKIICDSLQHKIKSIRMIQKHDNQHWEYTVKFKKRYYNDVAFVINKLNE